MLIRRLQKNTKTIAITTILLVAAYFQLFHRLGHTTLRPWDEAKNAVSAYEMLYNKQYLIRYYEGQPDNWGFKPPLLTWHQLIAMKAFGVNEFAVRFPSALYALFSALIIFFFLKNELKLPYAGFLAALVLLTSFGYLERHIARTGDHDSMLTFFLTAQTLCFYNYIKKKNQRDKYLAGITIALVLATLTKGVAGLFFVPGFILYAIFAHELKSIFIDRKTYIYLFVYLVIIMGYYLMREISSPGYLKAVWQNELIPRYTNTSTEESYTPHFKDYLFYAKNLWNKRLIPWIYLLPLFLITLFRTKNTKLKSIYLYLLLIGLTFLIIISLGTKNLWYDAPLYPLLAMIIATGISQVLSFIHSLSIVSPIIRYTLIILLLTPILYFSVNNTKRLTFEIKERPWALQEQGINYFLRNKIEHSEIIDNLGIAYSGYHSHIRFYVNQLNDTGSNISFVDFRNLSVDSKVIISEKKVMKFVEQNYTFSKKDVMNNTFIYYIKSKIDVKQH